MDPSSTLPAPHPHLSRDEKRRLFEEQKQRRLERYVACVSGTCFCLILILISPCPSPSRHSFSSVAPFGDRMEKIEDVEQIQDKVRRSEKRSGGLMHC